MKITQYDISKIEAEALEPYRLKLKKLLKPIQEELTNPKWYVEDLKTFNKIPKEYLPRVSSVWIPKKFVPNLGEIAKVRSNFQYVPVRTSHKDDALEIELTTVVHLPHFAIKECGCNKDHGVVILDCKEMLQELIATELQKRELISVLESMGKIKTLKALEQSFVGVEKLAPKTIGELKRGTSQGALMIATNVEKFAIQN